MSKLQKSTQKRTPTAPHSLLISGPVNPHRPPSCSIRPPLLDVKTVHPPFPLVEGELIDRAFGRPFWASANEDCRAGGKAHMLLGKLLLIVLLAPEAEVRHAHLIAALQDLLCSRQAAGHLSFFPDDSSERSLWVFWQYFSGDSSNSALRLFRYMG